MKGLEPSTFCMASRRSSQLSYIRIASEYSRASAAVAPRQPTARRRVGGGVRASLALLAALLAPCGCTAGGSETSADTETRPSTTSDVAVLVEHVERAHPDPWHDADEEAFERAAAELDAAWPDLHEDERLVGLMRLLAQLAPRDGHSGIFPLDSAHEPPLHLLPVRVYEFPEGPYVLAAPGRPELVRARVESIAGLSWPELRELVAPLVPHDNEQSLAARLPHYAVTTEILHGLGATPEAGPTPASLTLADGTRLETTLSPFPLSGGSARWRTSSTR